MSKYLGVDWGDKKIGLAMSDKLGITARLYKTITSNKRELINIINSEDIDIIVFGMPRKMDGSLGDQAKKVENFAEDLKKSIKAKVIYEDETNTTRLVKSQMIKEGLHPEKNKNLIDQKSAQLILEGYLNENKN